MAAEFARQERDSFAQSFAIAYRDPVVTEIDVLNAQS